jgi:hypothetical protein
MHKVIITICFSIISFASLAQLQKGAILAGGGFTYMGRNASDNFSTQPGAYQNDLKSTFLSIRPNVGFFLTESTLFGIALNYEYNSIVNQIVLNGNSRDPGIQKSNIILINPNLTKFIQLSDKFYFTTSVNLLAGLGKGSLGENNRETNILDLRINVTPGLTYFISNKWAIQGSIGELFYNYKREKILADINQAEGAKNVDHRYGLSAQVNTFRVGFRYYLNNDSEE